MPICGEMTTEDRTQITLRLEGSRAERGVTLSDLESFIDNFLAALRDFDRGRRGEPTRKSGHPGRRAEAVTAFRLVRFEPGSGIATVEPESLAPDENERLPLDEVPVSVETLRALVDELEAGAAVSEPVTDALGKACRSLGSDGSIAIHFPPHIRATPGRIDISRIEQLGHASEARPDEVRGVSGRLHLLDVEPDKLAIRTSSGIDWTCKYPEELEPTVKGLVGQIVWAAGTGHLTSPLRGTMTIERVEAVEQGEQSPLFTLEPTADTDLLARQGINRPQGFASLADPDWDDETDDVPRGPDWPVRAPTAERLLCDTSFVGLSAKRSSNPGRFSHWPADAVERIERSILAI